MKLLSAALGLISLIVGTPVSAQYNSSPIEKMCYGGRNQMGLHLCACDQGFISGMSALILGNSVVLHGPGELRNCLIWADDMNSPDTPLALGNRAGQTGAQVGGQTGGQIGNQTAKQASNQSGSRMPIETKGPCAEVYNACISTSKPPETCVQSYNQCQSAKTEKNRNEATEKGLLDEAKAEEMRRRSQSETSTIKIPREKVSDPNGKLAGMIDLMYSGDPFSMHVFCEDWGYIEGLGTPELPCEDKKTYRVSWGNAPAGASPYWKVCLGGSCVKYAAYKKGATAENGWSAPGTAYVRVPYVRIGRGVMVELTTSGDVRIPGANSLIGYHQIKGTAFDKLPEGPVLTEEPKKKALTWEERCPPEVRNQQNSEGMMCRMTSPHAEMSGGND